MMMSIVFSDDRYIFRRRAFTFRRRACPIVLSRQSSMLGEEALRAKKRFAFCYRYFRRSVSSGRVREAHTPT